MDFADGNFSDANMTRRGQIVFFVPALALFLVFVLLPSTETLIDSFHSHHGPNHEFVGALYYLDKSPTRHARDEMPD